MDWCQLHNKGCQKAIQPPAHKFTREGDLWALVCVNHILWCGACLRDVMQEGQQSRRWRGSFKICPLHWWSLRSIIFTGGGFLKTTNELINYVAGIEKWDCNTLVQFVKDNLKPYILLFELINGQPFNSI